MKAYEQNWVRLPLEKAYNVRELGGYPTASGIQTAYHRFLRADDTSTLTQADIDFLLGYGVRTVIDLRSDKEAADLQDPFMTMEGIRYVQIPYLGRDLTDATQMQSSDLEKGLAVLYRSILQNQSLTKEIFEVIADTEEGCVLFHCTVGKDRTGVLAMLLMSLAGADRQDCIANYEQTFSNLCRKPGFLHMVNECKKYKMEEMLYSRPETMANCYDWLMDTYGSTEAYLRDCGLSEETMDIVRRRMFALPYRNRKEATLP